jgi:hypothetical protein
MSASRSLYPQSRPMRGDIPDGQLRANNGLMHCGKPHPYSITSSARRRSDVGTSMPSTFAVLRLTTNSNLVGCDRQIGRLIALEDAGHVLTDLAICPGNAGAVTHQATSLGIFAPRVGRRHCIARRERDQLGALAIRANVPKRYPALRSRQRRPTSSREMPRRKRACTERSESEDQRTASAARIDHLGTLHVCSCVRSSTVSPSHPTLLSNHTRASAI